MATQPHRRMTYQEFDALPRYGMLTMLLDGEYIVLPSPKRPHARLVARLLQSLMNFLDAHPIGEAYAAPLDVVLSESAARVIQPDVFFVADQHLSHFDEARLRGMPDLAIEVLSRDANRYDKGKKLEYYDEYGIPELWHVHQDRPRIEIYRRDPPGRLRVAEAIGPGDTLRTPLLHDFELAIASLYRD